MIKEDSDFCLRWAKKLMAINLLGGVCKRCGNSDVIVLEFHHFNKDKESDINSLRGARWSTLKKEVIKCELLCRNCHSEIHQFGTKRNIKIKQKLLTLKGTDKCEECGYCPDNLGVLSFHHLRDKKFAVNVCRIRFPDVSWEDVILEIDKCKVLCHNCHIKKHTNTDKFNYFKADIDYKIQNHKEIQPKLDRELVKDMYFNQKMRQVDIVRHFKCSKGTISMIIKSLKQLSESNQKVTA